jgi:2'-5' RNA ligase
MHSLGAAQGKTAQGSLMLGRSRLRWLLVFAVLLFREGAKAKERGEQAPSTPDRVVAIDVLLEPDATMANKAEAGNARLRENYPSGYTLGKEQAPHITLVHGYLREKDLRTLEVEIAKLAQAARPLDWELTATGYTHAIWAGVAITTIGIERTRQLDNFQANVAKAVDHYRIADGTAAAFSTSRELPKIDKDIIDYVRNFATNSSGKKFNPHVTIGVAHEDFVKKMKAEPFEEFTFRPAGVAIYQLGNFGTAQKKLWEWNARASVKK